MTNTVYTFVSNFINFTQILRTHSTAALPYKNPIFSSCPNTPISLLNVFPKRTVYPLAAFSAVPGMSITEDFYYSNAYFYPTFTDMVFMFLPEIALAGFIVYLMLAATVELSRGRAPKVLAAEYWNAACFSLGFVCILYEIQVFSYNILAAPAFGGYLYISEGLATSKFFVALAGFFVLLLSENYIREHTRHGLEFSLITLIAMLFLLVLTSANNLMLVFFTITGFSLNLYVLIHYNASDAASREASLKYFYLSTLSAGLILFGILLIFITLGDVTYGMIRFLTEPGPELSTKVQDIVSTGALFVVLGFFFKLSACPGHLWAVEVYEGSPAPVMAFFLLPVKVAVFITFLRMLNTAFAHQSHVWLPCVTVAAILSLAWGAFAAAQARKTVRFLGYASINQIGLLLCGLVVDTDEAIRATFFYLILYALMTGGFLLVFTHLRKPSGRAFVALSDFRGLGQTEPLVCWNLSVFLFSMAGIPPLAGFFGKYFIVASLLDKGLYWPAIVILAVSLITTYYYLRVIKTFWFEENIAVKKPVLLLSIEQRTLLSVIEGLLWSMGLFSPVLLPLLDKTAVTLMLCG